MSIDHDQKRYQQCNIVERGVNWLKQCRILTPRLEKTAYRYLGLVQPVRL